MVTVFGTMPIGSLGKWQVKKNQTPVKLVSLYVFAQRTSVPPLLIPYAVAFAKY